MALNFSKLTRQGGGPLAFAIACVSAGFDAPLLPKPLANPTAMMPIAM
jgi:hypothetical protein